MDSLPPSSSNSHLEGSSIPARPSLVLSMPMVEKNHNYILVTPYCHPRYSIISHAAFRLSEKLAPRISFFTLYYPNTQVYTLKLGNKMENEIEEKLKSEQI